MMESSPLVPPKLALPSVVERHNALKEPGVGKAAHLVKDAVAGYQDAPYEGYYDPYDNERSEILNEISIVCGRLKVQLRGAATFTCWVLLMLTFFEPPAWCRDASHLLVDENDHANSAIKEHGYGDCKLLFDMYGTTADGEENQQLYPNFHSLWLTIYQSKMIELACVVFISIYMACAFGDDGFDRHLFFYPGSHKRCITSVRCIVLLCLLASVILDNATCNPILRMVILGTFLRSGQREMWTYLKLIPEIMVPISMIATVIAFYAWFGVVIFYQSREGQVAFPNLGEGMWTLWICVTTANYPDCMMPAFNENRLVALYFISFMVISFFYLMNLVLAIACNTYDESIEERRCSRQELSKRLLSEAFALLDSKGTDSVSRESIMHVMTILNQDVAEIQALADDEKAILYAILDKDGSNEISLEEFLGFGSVLLLSLSKRSDYATFVEAHLPAVFRSNFYQRFCKSIKSKAFERIMEVALVMNAVIIAVQDYPMLVGSDVIQYDDLQNGAIDSVWEVAETIFTVMYVVEALLKIMVNGWKSYIENARNLFDFSITVLAVMATMYVYYPNAYSDSRLIEFVIMARVLRLSRLIFSVESFQVFGMISLDIVPAAANVFLVLFFVAYSYAIAGVLLFGGVISRDPNNIHSQSLMDADDFVDSEYWSNNFNDMFSGMNVLFNMLVVNNWTIQASGMECATGNTFLVRFFFLSFHLLGVTGISNVITSFIINAFFHEKAVMESKREPVERMEGETVIEGSRAVFDTSEITGTKTKLHRMTYFAQMKTNQMDLEVDQRGALQEMFSKSSSMGIK